MTAAELARDAAAVRGAGADAVHLPVKDAEGRDTLDGASLAEVLATAARAARLVGLVAEVAHEVVLHGEGASAWPLVRLVAAHGLGTRIGLEDVLVLPDGWAAPDNAALVRAARALVTACEVVRADGHHVGADG